MKKSELYARYNNFNRILIEITHEEFFEHFTTDTPQDSVDFIQDGATECTIVYTDGWEYIRVGSTWNVGWQGDVDCDSFYCKIETVTKARMEEIHKMFHEDIF
jgi:hypothetical protein